MTQYSATADDADDVQVQPQDLPKDPSSPTIQTSSASNGSTPATSDSSTLAGAAGSTSESPSHVPSASTSNGSLLPSDSANPTSSTPGATGDNSSVPGTGDLSQPRGQPQSGSALIPQGQDDTAKEDGVDDGDEGLNASSLRKAMAQLGWNRLPLEELLLKKQAFKEKRLKISSYYRKTHRSLNTSKDALDIVIKAHRAKVPKPQRRTDVQVYQAMFYQARVKAEADRDWETAQMEYEAWKDSADTSEERKRPVRVAIIYAAAKRLLEGESEAVKEEMRTIAETEYLEKKRKWEEAKSLPVGEQTAENRAQAIKKWGPAVSKVTGALSKDLNMSASTVFFGDNPVNPGKIRLYWVHHGKTNSGLKWPEFDPVGYTATEASLTRFGKAILTGQAASGENSATSHTSVESSTQHPAQDTPTSSSSPIPSVQTQSSTADQTATRNKTKKARSKGSSDKSQLKPKPRPVTGTNSESSTPATIPSHSSLPTDSTAGRDIREETSIDVDVDSPVLWSDKNLSQANPPAAIATASGDNEIKAAGSWQHPKEKKFWPEMRRNIKEWGEEFVSKESEDWLDDLETMVDTFIEYEEAFKFTEENGVLSSTKEIALMKKWEEFGRPAWMDMVINEAQIDKFLESVKSWWFDLLPDRENDDDNWGPLDCVSGKNGMWRFVCCMVWSIVLLVGQQKIEERSDAQRVQIGEWMVLAREVEETLGKVIEFGIWPPSSKQAAKRKAEQGERSENLKRAKKQNGAHSKVSGTKGRGKRRS
ncbi:hypothetical protein D9758_015527 [Tetrapyrgos nigripes]|uniref:Uncharacterized protein n=1 Tax=Tetrapyrgos nigripes TaxID=182062 RepID=A0A8H5FUP0_9AGAR|nr:hypothetical protein D9758_015527 [Tetrapyrgos nigripes]